MNEKLSKISPETAKKIGIIVCVGIVLLLIVPFIQLFLLQLDMLVKMYSAKANVDFMAVFFLQGTLPVNIAIFVAIDLLITVLVVIPDMFVKLPETGEEGSQENAKKFSFSLRRILGVEFYISLLAGIPIAVIGGILTAPAMLFSTYYNVPIGDVYMLQYSSPDAVTSSLLLGMIGGYSFFAGATLVVYFLAGANLFAHKRYRTRKMLLVYIGVGSMLGTIYIPLLSLINVATPALSVSLWLIGFVFVLSGLLMDKIGTDKIKGLICLVFILVSIIGLVYSLQWQANYRDWEWSQEKVSLNLTAWATGAESIERYNVSSLQGLPASEALAKVRQWDKYAATNALATLIQNSWISITEADIVNIPSEAYAHEYWMFPTQVSPLRQTDWKNAHCIYTHSEGVYLVDAHSVVNQLPVIYSGMDAAAKLNLSKIPAIYYGDGESFLEDVFLGLGFNEYGNQSFEGTPDYVLEGWNSVLFHVMGWSTGGDISFAGKRTEVLMVRYVSDRVGKIMFPWLEIDDDPYLVTVGGKLYFAIGIYVHLSMPAMVYSDFYRMAGWALVDVESGYIRFFKYWNMDPSIEKLVSFYKWEDAPAEFRIQARFPECLAESIIGADMKIHVRPPDYTMEDWLSGADFYDFVPWLEGFFVFMPVNSSMKFVELYSAKFANVETTRILAAVYVVLSAEDCGKMIVYKMGEKGQSDVISSEFADDILDQNARVRETFALWKNYRYGNRVPLVVDNSFYWVVPVYLTKAGTGMETLGGVGVVDALSSSHPIGFGEDVVYAYTDLTGGTSVSNESGVKFRSLEMTPDTISENENSTIEYLVENYNNTALNVSVRLAVEAENVYVYQYNNNLTAITNGSEYQFILYNGTLNPGEIHGCKILINAKVPTGYSVVVVIIHMKIVNEDTGAILQDELLYLTVSGS